MKTEALEVLKNRRSIRKYKPDQITDEELNTVLEAGTYAPTAANWQTPVIIAVQDPQTVKKLSEMNAEVAGRDSDPFYGAPTVLLVLADTQHGTAIADGSSVLCNLLNAAYAVGLGSCWIAREKEMFESEEGKAMLKSWGVEGNYMGIGACILGYPDCDHPVAKPRKDNYVISVK
jgi:nitroreductase